MLFEEQNHFEERITEEHRTSFDFMYPIWRCPCGWLNRFVNTFGETCAHCRTDHTLDWEAYIADPVVKRRWEEDAQVERWEAVEWDEWEGERGDGIQF